MPSSYWGSISKAFDWINGLNPSSVLDVGIGFGKWGFLSREYLDVYKKRWSRDSWAVRIDGVEVFSDYINECHRYIYNNIYNVNIKDFIFPIKYDLIMMMDVLEHMGADEVEALVQRVRGSCGAVLVNIPIGEDWLRNSYNSNKHEAHVSAWTVESIKDVFKDFDITNEHIYDCGKRKILLFLAKPKVSIAPGRLRAGRSNVLLQYCNVWWKGGVSLLTLDIVRALPEFFHVICYRHKGGVDYDTVQTAQAAGVDLSHMPVLGEDFVKELNPFATIVHNMGRGGLSGSYPHSWVLGHPMAYWHHSAVRPWIPFSHEIFASNYLKSLYDNLKDRIKNPVVIPPCIDVKAYGRAMDMRKDSDKIRLGMVLSTNKKKYSSKMVEAVEALVRGDGRYTLTVAGSVPKSDGRVTHLGFLSDMISFYKDIDVLINYPEKSAAWGSWERVVTEALAAGCYVVGRDWGGIKEQLQGSVFPLVDGLDSLISVLGNLKNISSGDFRGYARDAYSLAMGLADKSVLRERLLSVVLKLGLE